MRRLGTTAAAAAAVVVACLGFGGAPWCGVRPAAASVVYSYVPGADSYSATPGSSVQVPIYLQETLSDGGTSQVDAYGGLFGASAALQAISATGGTASQVAAGGFTFNSAFDGGATTNLAHYNQPGGAGAAGNNLEFTEAMSITDPAGVGQTAGRVYLGTATITVGAGTTTYSLSSVTNEAFQGQLGGPSQGGVYDTISPLNAGGHSLDFDTGLVDYSTAVPGLTGANDAPASTFTVSGGNASPVPEPASVAVFALAAAGLLRRRGRATIA